MIRLENFDARERKLLEDIHQRVEGYKTMVVLEPKRRIDRLQGEITTLKRLLLEARRHIQPCADNSELLAEIDAKLQLVKLPGQS